MKTRFTELVGRDAPIQLAGMGPICSDELCAAVSEAGGLGMITVAATTPEGLAARLDHIRSLTSRPIGTNFLIPVTDRDCLRMAARTARVVDFFWGDPDPELVQVAHGGGALVSWQVGSAAEAVTAERAGCDFIIAQGIEAGGHQRGRLGLLPLLSQVLLDRVTIPVLAAGGIGSPRALAAVLAAGAAGARCGTRFVAAQESAAHPIYVDALLRAHAEDAVRTTRYHVGCPLCPSTHGVLNAAIEAAQSLTGDVVGELEMAGQTVPIARFHGLPPSKAMTGHIEATALYAGQSVGDVRAIQPAAEIVAELVAGPVGRPHAAAGRAEMA